MDNLCYPMDMNHQSTTTIMESIVTVPDWMLDEQEVRKRSLVAMKELTDVEYSTAFEHVLVNMSDGTPIADILREYHTKIDPKKFLAWIFNDKDRKRRYYTQKEIGAEAIEEQILKIADAADNSLEDVQRSKLRVDARFRVLGYRDKKRFGNTPDVTGGGLQGGINIVIAGVTSPYQSDTNVITGEVLDNE